MHVLPLLMQLPAPDSTFENFVRGLPTVDAPVPDPVAKIFAAIFNAPQWMWAVGVLIVVGGGIWATRSLWVNRVAIRDWLVSRDRGVKIAMVSGLVVVLGTVALTGTASWNYMQHDNDFCSSCHVMEGPWNKFASDAGKHSDLECHDCHQQSIIASTRELVLWVANRPEEIPAHAPVGNETCEKCHNTKEDEKWTRVAETAGHRTHMESDSVDLKDVQCVTCHGKEVHAFVPAKQTCGMSGCHENTEIKLGKMASQTALHCNQCHQFTAEVPLLATRDSAAGTMRPGKQQCLGCHEMERVLTGFVPELEPHGSTCGTCHNPHTQETPKEAEKTCTTAGCHANWKETPFHTGTNHRGATGTDGNCMTCHQPHASKVDASDCVACHTAVRERGGAAGRRLPPMPFDTARVLRMGSAIHGDWLDEPGRGKGDVRPPDLPPSVRPAESQPAVADTFPHKRHTSLACITCHVTPDAQDGGRLTFEAPRGCQICHHQASQSRNCAACHQPDELATPAAVTVAIATPKHPARDRTVLFAHPTHAGTACATCHTTPVSLAPADGVRKCADCHTDHHAAGRNCAACHSTPQLREAHGTDLEASHQRCDACHTASTVAQLLPDRSFCLTCHAPEQREHHPAKECTTCHQLTTPEGYRPRLLGGGT